MLAWLERKVRALPNCLGRTPPARRFGVSYGFSLPIAGHEHGINLLVTVVGQGLTASLS